MSPEDKAKELIEKYSFCITTYKGTSIMGKEIAKQCALICVDEKIDTLNKIDNGGALALSLEIDYLNEVKQEINKTKI